MRRCSPIIVFVLGAGCLGAQIGADFAPASIRTDIALKVGAAEISQYAVEKNLSRFLRSGNGKARPSTDAIRTWLELFLARQVVIAEALAQGYDRRPEVVRMVDTMERHMLAQAEPAVAPPTDAELRAVYERLPVPPDGLKPAFEQQRSFLEKILRQERRLAFRRTQSDEAVRAMGLEIDRAGVGKLFQRLQAEPPSTTDISVTLTAPLAGERLATYRLGDQAIELTVDGWRTRFNALFVRELPTNLVQLEAGIRELAVAEYATHEGRRRGIDREPRFIEDRRNFVYYQALDLFEKEKLLPQVAVTSTETETYYREHRSEFSRPVRAKGKLLRFADADAAMAWMRTGRESASDGGETIEVSRESPLVVAPAATEPILNLDAGRPLGPIPVPFGAVVFVKQSTEAEPAPYPMVAEAIQARLARSRLDVLELRLAREWVSRHPVEDRLRPEEFGLAGPVEKPWGTQR
jgi:hypothetical protein